MRREGNVRDTRTTTFRALAARRNSLPLEYPSPERLATDLLTSPQRSFLRGGMTGTPSQSSSDCDRRALPLLGVLEAGLVFQICGALPGPGHQLGHPAHPLVCLGPASFWIWHTLWAKWRIITTMGEPSRMPMSSRSAQAAYRTTVPLAPCASGS